MEELYKRIKERRTALGMSQEELARKAGYTSRSTIARIEHGEINLPQSKVNTLKALETHACVGSALSVRLPPSCP